MLGWCILNPPLQTGSSFLFVFCHMVQLEGSQFSDQGANPCPLAVETQRPNPRTNREVPGPFFSIFLLRLK